MNDNGHSKIISLLGGGKKLTARLKSLSEENVNEKTVYSLIPLFYEHMHLCHFQSQ